MNQKAAAAMEKKATAQSVKDAKAAAEREKELQTEWSKGANNRGAARSEQAALKADVQARKKREKAALLAAEEEALGSGSRAKKIPTLSKKGKKKKNDLSLLEDALVSGAEKKQKAKKKAELAKAEKMKAEAVKKKAEDEKPIDPMLANTDDMLQGTTDELVGRAANKALNDEHGVSGIDGALGQMSLNGSHGSQNVSTKGLFKAFEERMMPEVKRDYPGLKLSQYKEKVFQMWKKSPENPANQ